MWKWTVLCALTAALWGCGSSESSDDLWSGSDTDLGFGTDTVVADPGGPGPRDAQVDDPGSDALAGDPGDGDGDIPNDLSKDAVDDTVDDGSVSPCGVCTGGKVCIENECQCPVSLVDCSGECKPLGTNADCSECGDSCPTGGSCQAGECKCPGSQVNCFGICTQLGTNTDCSECGDACVGVKRCELGECTAPVDPECLPTVPCVTNDDCPSGARCNQAIQPPACQKLYCGGFGSACSDDWFCLSQTCQDDVCVSDCSGLECGPDPVYGESCGTCETGATCQSGQCFCEPEDHKECCGGNVCWIDSCGNQGAVVEGCPLACLNGSCVECAAIGQENCSGVCKQLGTTTDCSDCGDSCPVGGSCQAGECRCPFGETDCFGVCKPLGTNTDCFECGDACRWDQSCRAGSCQCPIGEADCAGTCTPLGTTDNCSDCGDVCPKRGVCEDGQCVCPLGEVDCLGVCTPLGTMNNCSDCGDACPLNGFCIDFVCNEGCTDFPDTWGPIGAVSVLQTPSNTTVAGSSCFDFTGDGIGDSSLVGLAGQLNPGFVDGLDSGALVALFEFPALASYWDSPAFVLAGLTGESGYLIDPISYGADCTPVNRFDAVISQGKLVATSSSLVLEMLPFFEEAPGTSPLIPMIDAHLVADVIGGGPNGVVMSDGVLSGVITKAVLTTWIDDLQAECNAAPPGDEPTFCGYLGMARQLLPTLFDLHRTDGGMYYLKDSEHPANAMSVCLQFETIQAKSLGMICTGASCECTPNDHRVCLDGDAYWFDSCDVSGDLIEDCKYGCTDGYCNPCDDPVGSCKAAYECMGECPTGTAGEACVQQCQNQLSADGMADYQAFNQCLQTNCAGATTSEEFYACLEANCMNEYYGCFWGCTYLTCDDMKGCIAACPDDNPATTTINEFSTCYGDCSLESTMEAQIACSQGDGGCYNLLVCLAGAETMGDQYVCILEASENALDMYNAIPDCLNAACPVCEVANPTPQQKVECDECVAAEQQEGGACNTTLVACTEDRIYGTGGCADLWDCFMTCEGDQACQQACAAEATQTAAGLMSDVFDCIDDACNQYEDETEWANCANAVINQGGVCETQMTACLGDGSGTTPTTCDGACNPAEALAQCMADGTTFCTCDEGTSQWTSLQCAEVCDYYDMEGDQCIADNDGSTCDCSHNCEDAMSVTAQCEEGRYTPCTCAVANPCEWIGDGYCDTPRCNELYPDQTNFDDTGTDCN